MTLGNEIQNYVRKGNYQVTMTYLKKIKAAGKVIFRDG